jgi:hypothetical protein
MQRVTRRVSAVGMFRVNMCLCLYFRWRTRVAALRVAFLISDKEWLSGPLPFSVSLRRSALAEITQRRLCRAWVMT